MEQKKKNENCYVVINLLAIVLGYMFIMNFKTCTSCSDNQKNRRKEHAATHYSSQAKIIDTWDFDFKNWVQYPSAQSI